MIGFFLLIKPFAADYQVKKNTQQAIIQFTERVEAEKIDFVKELEECLKSEENVSLADYGIFSEKDIDKVYIPDMMFDLRSRVSEETREKLPEIPFADIYNSMYEYNISIFENNQSELKDVFSYTTNDFELEPYGLKDDIIGFITVDAMNIKLPMYIGSSEEHMAHGTTIMNQTSMPIGGNNTNCVVAAHRSFGFFANIENLSEGDTVIVNNLWGEMGYRVIKTIIISPYDIDKVKIYPDHELLTLMTCHPYGINNERYVVYCVRDDSCLPERVLYNAKDSESTDDKTENVTGISSGEIKTDNSDNVQHEHINHEENSDFFDFPSGEEFVSSSKSIQYEIIVRVIGIIMTGIFIIIFIIMRISELIRSIKSQNKVKETLIKSSAEVAPSDF